MTRGSNVFDSTEYRNRLARMAAKADDKHKLYYQKSVRLARCLETINRQATVITCTIGGIIALLVVLWSIECALQANGPLTTTIDYFVVFIWYGLMFIVITMIATVALSPVIDKVYDRIEQSWLNNTEASRKAGQRACRYRSRLRAIK